MNAKKKIIGARAASLATLILPAGTVASEAARAPNGRDRSASGGRRVYEIVAFKRAGEANSESGDFKDTIRTDFRGWHTRGYLPHCDRPGLMQMVTYRLSDAMPATRRRQWIELSKIENERERMIAFEGYLDKGYGACALRNPSVAQVVEEGWLFGDGKKYRLLSWVIMPNHVHLLVEVWDVPLSQLVHTWKGYSARRANPILHRTGEFWQRDFWDRYIRDEGHFNKAVRYIESNPVKSALVSSAELWAFSSANPKWKWTDASTAWRYRGVHLVSDNWGASEAALAPEHVGP